ncbi:MAG: extracellular solute-binding protein, partial [Candidatus Aerophobus sp.]
DKRRGSKSDGDQRLRGVGLLAEKNMIEREAHMISISPRGAKIVILWVASLLCFAVLLGTQMSVAQTTVVFQTFLTRPSVIEAQKKIVADFEKNYPEIKIDFTAIPGTDAYPKTVSSIAAGSPPGIGTAGTGWQRVWQEMGGLTSVDDVIQRLGGKDIFDQVMMKENLINDEAYGVPLWTSGAVIYYREDWYQEKGLTVPLTWWDLYSNAKDLTEDLNGDGSFDRYGYGIQTGVNRHPQKVMWSFIVSNGGTVFDPEGNLNFVTPRNIETYKFLARLVWDVAPPGSENIGREDVLQSYRTGKIAQFYTAPYFLNILRDLPELWEKTNITLVPKNKGEYGACQKGTVSLVVFDTPRAEQAKVFAEFLMRDENYVPFLLSDPYMMLSTKLPLRSDPNYINAPVFQPEKSKHFLEKLLEAVGHAYPLYMYYKPTLLGGAISGSRIIPDTLQKIVIDKFTAEEAVKWGEQQMRELL